MLIDHMIVDSSSILGDIFELIIVLVSIVEGRVPGRNDNDVENMLIHARVLVLVLAERANPSFPHDVLVG